MKRQYHSVRKVSWDMLWHAMWKNAAGKETWDRVTKRQALSISKKLIYA